MTWQLTTFTILGLALAAGFSWYERTHPSSKVLAMVATLAALAAIGRVAFAPLPNVKPTTDIVLLSGYVLGGAPGFAVGALGGLSSNLVFGQGPWTPWQMAAWGLIGIIGAGWARVTRRRLPRWATAVVCALCGLLYGAITNLSTLTAAGGTPTLAQWGATQAAAVPFDVAHAVGNVAFFLAFGPAFVRVLQRYRARLEVRWTDTTTSEPRPLGEPSATTLFPTPEPPR
jgi:energy-coupling factor transport system substrate-specific component